MNIYLAALFLHIIGALGFFIALGLEWNNLRYLQLATTAEQVHEWLHVPNEMRPMGMISVLTLLTAGFYIMAIAWGGVPWILVTLGAIILMITIGRITAGRCLDAIGLMVKTEQGPLSYTLHDLLHDPVLRISVQTRAAIALGIVFLMTVKLGLIGSLFTIAAANVLGLASALPMFH